MKHVAIVTQDYAPDTGGVSVYWQCLLEQLSERFVVVAPERADAQQASRVIRIPFLYTHIWPRWLLLMFTLQKIIRTHAMGHVIVGQILPVGTVACLLQLLGKIEAYSISCHAMDVQQLTGRKRLLATLLLRRARVVFVNSDYTKDLVSDYGIDASKMHVVTPSVSKMQVASVVPTLVKQLQGKTVVLSVGRLVERKGIDTVIAALPQVWKYFPEVVYCIVGDGADRERLEELIARTIPASKRSQIVFAGEVAGNELASYYEAATIFALPTKQKNGDVEGFGIVNIEAASFGLPVVASDISGKTKSVVDRQTGLLVPSEDVAATAQAILELLQDTQLRTQLGEAGKRYAAQFSWQSSANVIERAI